jgi:hypothetical protein
LSAIKESLVPRPLHHSNRVMENGPRLGKMTLSDERGAMSDKSQIQSPFAKHSNAADGGRSFEVEAWRKTFAAAVRVMAFHRSNLEARMTIRRAQRDESKAARDEVAAAD